MLAGRVGAALVGLCVVLAAPGLLYLIQPRSGVPGPSISDALPLDELSRRSAVPLLVFVAVWGAAALLLALVARSTRLERLTAALILALAVGLWSYFQTGVSLLIVRQIAAQEAFSAAAHTRGVYLPALLSGLAGALAGRSRGSASPRGPLLLAWLTAAVGVLGLVDAILPQHRHTLLAALAPERVHPLASALVAPLSLALLAVAPGLARRRRRAWQLALGLLAGLTLLHVLHSFTYGAMVAGALMIGLIARRGDFRAPGDPTVQPRIALQTVAFAAVIFGYGAAAVWINRLMADRPYTLAFALHETAAALLGTRLQGSAHLNGSFGKWFPESVLLIGVLAAAVLLRAWVAPWRYRLRQEAREREVAKALVTKWGIDTLAPFALRGDKSYFFGDGERAFLAYRVVGGVAIVSGDPVGDPAEFRPLIERFVGFGHERDWRVTILGASEHCLELYREFDLHALYHGDEALIDVDSFSLEGRAIRKVRQSVHRLGKAGYRAEVRFARELDARLRAELDAVAREWRAGEPERGFVMALDALFRLGDEDAIFVIGRCPAGRPEGFLHFAVLPACGSLSLSSMPRRRSTPNGFNEWLICETVDWAKEHGYARISLNFAPFASLLAPEAVLSGVQRVERRALLSLKGHFQLDNLLLFNRKFLPTWERRFVVYERKRDLPRVGIAALAAEAYLPWPRRGRA